MVISIMIVLIVVIIISTNISNIANMMTTLASKILNEFAVDALSPEQTPTRILTWKQINTRNSLWHSTDAVGLHGAKE